MTEQTLTEPIDERQELSRGFSRYQSILVALLALVQFTIIIDFMIMSPLGAIIMPALNISAAQFGVAVSDEAELHRKRGELLLDACRNSAPAAAEACFHQAIAVARAQRTKSWELRAATSLARLWRDQGKHTEARDLLAPIYGWFTEGFDTLDLKEAKALLNELHA